MKPSANFVLALIGIVFCAIFALLMLPRLAHAAPSMTEPVTHFILAVSTGDIREVQPIVTAWHNNLQDCHDEARKKNLALQKSGQRNVKLVCVELKPEML